jgi:CheY-like chemotaxis protein
MAQLLVFPHHSSARHTVLLVDDEYLVRGVLSEILQDSGFAVAAVASAPEAIALLSGPGRIDLVFSDVKMEPMDGFELARWIREHRPGLPVILASGYPSKTGIAADLHGVEFFRKPFDFDAVVEKIRDTIAQTARTA